MDNETNWKAILDRDPAWDAKFVYGVRSTGIYCRPTCPSRKPGRNQVVFFDNPEGARSAGFRPCKRCKPNQTGHNPRVEKIREACRFIDSRPDETLTLKTIGEAVHLSPFHLQRLFKRVTGLSPHAYQQAARMNRFKNQLREGTNVTSAIYEAGFGSSSRLYERSNQDLGMTPSSYRAQGRGQSIGYTVVESPIGKLLIAATNRGVCKISFAATDRELEQDLARQFSAATVSRDDAGLKNSARQILEYLAGRQPRLDLPLDLIATAFQRQVWEALKTIPYGQTSSYSDVADKIGSPRAVRAVARAIASNPVALAIPCHRVIPKSGGPGGYRWGAERKKALLKKEADSASSLQRAADAK